MLTSQKKIAFFVLFFKRKIEIAELCKGVRCVDLGESFPTNPNEYLVAEIGFATAENEPCKVRSLERCDARSDAGESSSEDQAGHGNTTSAGHGDTLSLG